MPQVPLPRVSDSPARTPQVSAPGIAPVQDSTGQQIQQAGAALSNLGAHATDIAGQVNEEHALATAKGGLNEWAEFADRSDQEYRTTAGKAATEIDGVKVQPGDAPKKVAERMEAEMRRIEDGMSNDLAKQVFRQHAERGMVTYRGRLQAHELKQIRVHNHAESVAMLGRHVQGYVMNGDPADFKSALTAAEEISDSVGHGPEAQKEFLLDTRTSMHSGYIQSLLVDTAPDAVENADEYLRGIDRGGIDAVARQKMRKQINGVIRSKAAKKLGTDLVLNNGWSSTAQRPLQEAKIRELEQKAETAVLELAQEEGVSDKDLKFIDESGSWEVLLSDPRIMARMPDEVLSLEQEIIKSRFPQQESPLASQVGTHRRSMDHLRELYKQGKIDVDQLDLAQRAVTTQIQRRMQERDVEANELLQAIEDTGLAIDSPEFVEQYSSLRSRAIDLGVVSQARSLNRRETSEVHLDEAWRLFSTGELGQHSLERVRVTFKPYLSKGDWNNVYGLWAKSQPDLGDADKLSGGKVLKYDETIRLFLGDRGLISGKVDKNGIKTPKVLDATERQRWVSLRDDLNLSDVQNETQLVDWLNKRFTTRATVTEPGFFWDTNHEVFFAETEHAYQTALATGDQAKIDEAYENKTNARITMSDGRVVRADATTVLGPDGDLIPPRAIDFFRDEWRMQQLKLDRSVPGRDYNTLDLLLERSGALNPEKTVSARSRAMIELGFKHLNMDTRWPAHEEQWTWWKKNRPRRPWAEIAPLPAAAPPSGLVRPSGEPLDIILPGRQR